MREELKAYFNSEIVLFELMGFKMLDDLSFYNADLNLYISIIVDFKIISKELNYVLMVNNDKDNIVIFETKSKYELVTFIAGIVAVKL